MESNVELIELTNDELLDSLWKKRYWVNVPQDALIPEEDLIRFGTVTTGNRDIDAALRSNVGLAYWTVNEMAECLDRGYDVFIVNSSEGVIVYEDIIRHLTLWSEAIEGDPFNNPNAPYSDLLKLDNLAGKLFESVKYVYHKNGVEGRLSNRLRKLGTRSMFGKTRNNKLNQGRSAAPHPSLLPKKSEFEEYFKQNMVLRRD